MRESYSVTVERRDTANDGEEWNLAVDGEPVGAFGIFNTGHPWTPAEALRRLLKRTVES